MIRKLWSSKFMYKYAGPLILVASVLAVVLFPHANWSVR